MLLAVAQQEDEVPTVRREAVTALVVLLEDDKRKEEVRRKSLLHCQQFLLQPKCRRRLTSCFMCVNITEHDIQSSTLSRTVHAESCLGQCMQKRPRSAIAFNKVQYLLLTQ